MEVELNEQCEHSFFFSKKTNSVKFCSKCGIMKYLNVILISKIIRLKRKDLRI
jgi:hypothetical protein